MKIDLARQHRWDERRHRLAEHVAERQEIQESEGEKRTAILPVLQHFPLNGFDICEHVTMGDDDALGLGRRARGKDDFCGRIERNGLSSRGR